MALVDRFKNSLLTPKTEWPVIAGESPTVQSLYVGYIVILAAIGPIALAARSGLFGMGLGVALISYVIGLIMTYLLAWIVDALAPSFGGERNFIKSLELTAYSFTAAWLAGIFHLVPAVGGLISLAAAIYSFYTFFLGAPVLKKCPREKAAVYTIVVVLCAMLLGAVLYSALFSSLMSGGVLGTMGLGM